jgi:hypothetical protein
VTHGTLKLLRMTIIFVYLYGCPLGPSLKDSLSLPIASKSRFVSSSKGMSSKIATQRTVVSQESSSAFSMLDVTKISTDWFPPILRIPSR